MVKYKYSLPIMILSLFVVFLSILCVVIKISNNNLGEDNQALQNLFKAKQKETADLNMIYSYNIGRCIDTTFQIKTINGILKSWETITDYQKVYYVFSEVNCSDCIVKDISFLNNLPGSIRNRMIILADYKNSNDLSRFIRINQIRFPVYLIDKEQFFESFRTIRPFFYKVDESLRISNFHISIDTDNEDTEMFIDNCF